MTKVVLKDALKHYLNIGECVNDIWEFPFAKNHSFIFFALDLLERERIKNQESGIRNQGRAFFKHHKEMNEMSITEF